jgi:hypothetical protein
MLVAVVVVEPSKVLQSALEVLAAVEQAALPQVEQV